MAIGMRVDGIGQWERARGVAYGKETAWFDAMVDMHSSNPSTSPWRSVCTNRGGATMPINASASVGWAGPLELLPLDVSADLRVGESSIKYHQHVSEPSARHVRIQARSYADRLSRAAAARGETA